ncbi:MAG: hypothetical protein QNK04_09250 [Myxococcota bacterium]|nr:hypothetical protein [Myxococcota bacterium]
MTLDPLETAFLVIGIAAALSTVLLGWRAFQLRALEPPCGELSTVRGTPTAIRFDHRFYSDWWLDFSIASQPFRVEPGPWQGLVHRELRESKSVRVGFCPTASRTRVWALEARGQEILSPEAQRIHAQRQARVALIGALLCLVTAAYCTLLPRRPAA